MVNSVNINEHASIVMTALFLKMLKLLNISVQLLNIMAHEKINFAFDERLQFQR